MKLKNTDINKLESFLAKIKTETYPEPDSELHTNITNKMFISFIEKYSLEKGSKILDIGCGQGVAMRLFKRSGFAPVGIALNPKDVEVCKKKNFEVYEMDQSFLDFEDKYFDFVWCRHVLEHSIFPYFTLNEIYRVLKPFHYLYVEVPAPETSSFHEGNKNHYSVFGKSMWVEIFKRSNFEIIDILDLNFNTVLGADTYWSFIMKKND